MKEIRKGTLTIKLKQKKMLFYKNTLDTKELPMKDLFTQCTIKPEVVLDQHAMEVEISIF